MSKRPDPFMIDEENPEWTDEMFARAKRGRDMQPERNAIKRWSLPSDLIAKIESTGPDYGARVEAALRAALAEGRI